MKGNRGMTLIEIMIVLAIVGLLVAVAVPKYGNLLEKANLGATLGNLSSLRSSVSIYYATSLQLPNSIDPAECADMSNVVSGGVPFVKAKTPRLNPPYGNEVTVGDTIPSTMGSGWYYSPKGGDVRINSTALDMKGVAYTHY